MNARPHPEVGAAAAAAVDAALATRCSVRAFLPTPVERTTIEATLGAASRAPSGTNTQPWILQSVMIAARARGLDTCPQAAFLRFHRIILDHLGAPPGEQLVCGMSLGHADPAAPENRLATERAPVADFTRFHE